MWNRAFIALFVVTITASAAQLYVDGYGRTNSGQVNAGTYNSAVAGDILYDSQSTPLTSGGRYSNFSYAARAGFGNLGFQYQMEAACNVEGCGVESVDGYIRVGSYDPLFIVGAQSGILAIDILFEGTASGNYSGDDFAWLYYYIGNLNALATYSQITLGLQYPSVILQNNYGSTVAYQPVGPLHVFSGTAHIPFSNSETTLNQVMGGQWYCTAGEICSFDFNFFNSARVGNARILDETGTFVIPGATITSESGYDYTQPIADTSVPEPGSLIAVASGLLLLLRRRLAYYPKSHG